MRHTFDQTSGSSQWWFTCRVKSQVGTNCLSFETLVVIIININSSSSSSSSPHLSYILLKPSTQPCCISVWGIGQQLRGFCKRWEKQLVKARIPHKRWREARPQWLQWWRGSRRLRKGIVWGRKRGRWGSNQQFQAFAFTFKKVPPQPPDQACTMYIVHW